MAYKKTTTIIMSLVTIGVLSGCGGSSSKAKTSDAQEVPKLDTAALSVSGEVVDATTHQALKDVTLRYRVATDGVTLDGNTSTSSELGLVSFSANNKTATINVLASKEGYVDTGIQILANNENSKEFTINMVKIDNTPKGVKVEEKKVISENGAVAEKVVIKASVDNASTIKGESTEVIIPKGTVLRDQNGKELTGELKATVTHYSASEESSTDAFPGGFAVIAETNQTTEKEESINFVTAGFTSISIKDKDGNKVKKFDTAIEVKMQIKEGTINPDTGVAIKIGEEVPVWSYNEETGKWAYEQKGNIKDLDTEDGFYDVVVETKHLSYWNLDWHYSAVCNSGLRLNLMENGELSTDKKIYMRANFTGSSGYLYNGYIWYDGYADLRNVPLNKEIEVKAYDSRARTVLLGSKKFTVTDAICNGQEALELPINTTSLPTKKPQTFSVVEQCSDGSKRNSNLPGLSVYAYDQGGYAGWGTTDSSGKVTINVLNKGTNKFYLYIGGNSQWSVSPYHYERITSSYNEQGITYTLTLDKEYCTAMDQSTN